MQAFASGGDPEHRGDSSKNGQMEHHVEGSKHGSTDFDLETTRAPNIFERAKEEFEAIEQVHKEHHREYSVHHGTDQNHNEDLDVEDVRAPNIFERAKEEVEAITQSLREKQIKSHQVPAQNDGNANNGCWTYMGKALERFCGGSRT